MAETISIVLKGNTSMLLQKKMTWYSKVYPPSEYDTTYGEPFTTRDGERAIKVTRLKEKK